MDFLVASGMTAVGMQLKIDEKRHRSSWLVSIRTRIFLGCISLTFVTIFVGMLSESSQVKLSKTTLGIYDNAFVSMSYLRSAQTIILNVSRDIALGEHNKAVFVAQLQSAMDALDVAQERAMSPRGASATKGLLTAVANLQTDVAGVSDPPARWRFKQAERDVDMAVTIYAEDGIRLRRSAEALVVKTRKRNYMAISGSIAIAILITFLLSHAIVPSINRAVRIATSIADGHLDNKMDLRGPSETGRLLAALASMQDSIADKIACIERLMARQASSHAAEISIQHSRFEAALNHMTQGLCMFDVGGKLLVQNQRFIEMFAAEAPNANAASLLAYIHNTNLRSASDDASRSRTFNRILANGRIISICEEAMEGGGRVVTYEDITERQRAEDRLSHMARHDALTSLPNRVVFRERIESGVRIAGAGMAVFCLDLDRFKTVNDALGHSLGDALLCATAIRLQGAVDEGDLVARLGGDEFAVVTSVKEPRSNSMHLAERLIDVLSEPFEIDGHRIDISASIGIIETWDERETPDSLLKSADLALYAAKGAGRGTFRFFENEMEIKLLERRQLEIDLHTALVEEQFEVFYQPLVSAASGTVVSFEALLRWHHPVRGLVSPTEFIPAAEEAGLIPVLGLWVLNQACSDAVNWPNGVRVAVNLSPLQFRTRGLVDDVKEAIQRSGLSSSRLDLEITESLLLQDNDLTIGILHDLHEVGVRISMDDFGTGYSSLNYLLRFPFDKIKIDRTFVRDMNEGSDRVSVVRAIIDLGRSLRINVVAEGVETAEQMNLLRTAGCQELQGYLLSRPQPFSATKEIIETFATHGFAKCYASEDGKDALEYYAI